ncbi:MAG: aminotransferase class V-fold PLP-dependent enzyme, partial [Acidobacteriaceae bacterium]|nr:aminotransferase class V-fold PLP-dependent enzyme [Acidobacteriaceae bacterium]
DLAHAHGAIFYADAVQAAGMIDIDVQAAGVDALCTGSYKWLMSEFGVAPFFVSRDVIDRIHPDRIGEFSVEKQEPDYHYQLLKTGEKFEGTSRAFGAVAQLQAALEYLQNISIARIEQHTVGLASRLYQGLSEQGHRLTTPAGNGSSIVAFRCSRPIPEVRKTFHDANVEVTVRSGYVRIAPALFNNLDEIEQCLAVTKRLA